MVGHLRSSGRAFKRAATPLLLSLGLSISVSGLAQAAQPGHGRVNSIAGAPLEVSVPVNGLTVDDLKVLKATIAEPTAWTQAGLTLPAPLETLSLSIEPGMNASSRTLVLRSTQAVNRPVVDVLISLTTASGTAPIQSSYLVLTSERLNGSGQSVQVVRGDTLFAISQSRLVAGADIYQVMWAIYEANPQAFISENMNLLRVGATLQIPDASTIRQVDPKFARAMFSKHDGAFRARRSAGGAAIRTQVVVAPPVDSGKVTTYVEAPVQPSAKDQVRLASTNPADLQADERVAASNALSEMQSRVEALQKNIDELRDALQKSQAAAAGKTVTSGTPHSVGAPVMSGSSGAPGTPGVAGTPGTPGAPGAPGVIGAQGVAGTPGAAGVPGLSGSAGASGEKSLADRSNASGDKSTADSAHLANSAAQKSDATTSTGGQVSSSADITAKLSSPDGSKHAGEIADGSTSITKNTQPGSEGSQQGTQSNDVIAANEVKSKLLQLKEYVADHVLGLVLGVSGLLALLIAFLLRRAGRKDEQESIDDAPRNHPGLTADFDQKLQAIDLNLDSNDTTVGSKSDAPKSGV